MTSKKAIKQMMEVVVKSDTERLCSYIVTSFRLTNEVSAMMEIHCDEG